MKNLKIFIALIALVFIAETTLKAGRCFDMAVSTEYYSLYTAVTITITNYSGEAVTINDSTTGRRETYSGSTTVTWIYPLNAGSGFDSDIFTTIECTSSVLCRQSDGCVIVIDPRQI